MTKRWSGRARTGWLCGLWLAAISAMTGASAARAQQTVHFPSLDAQATALDGYLFPASGPGRHPALVFLHGCGGLLTRSGAIVARERQWARRFNALGVTVLMVDSLTPRHHGKTCAPSQFDARVHQGRPYDAYGALRFLQARADVRADRVGVMGWSAGGGVALDSIRAASPARRAAAPDERFRAAVAFYPGSCSHQRQGVAAWESAVPLLVLLGGKDVWIPLQDCQDLFANPAPTSGTQVTLHVYADAYHDFDWPDMPVHGAPAYRTRAGVVPIEGTDTAARQDALRRVPQFLMPYLLAP